MDYFKTPNMRKSLQDFHQTFGLRIFSDDFLNEKLKHLNPVIEHFIGYPDIWDSTTQYNIKHLSNIYHHELSIDISKRDDIDKLIGSTFRFCIEMQLKSAKELPRAIREFKEFCIDKADNFTTFCQSEIKYALHDMPVGIISSLLNSDEMTHLQCVPTLLSTIQKTTNDWSIKLDASTKKVEELQKKLENQKNAFNFVGLHEGFNSLSRIKKIELRWAKIILFALGVAITLPIIYEIISIEKYSMHEKINTNQFFSFLPIASLTLILIYFFRVSLVNFQSIRSQIVQIELRKTLCAFIQSYAEYAKEIKTSDSDTLKKFEDVVFTNIMTSEEKVPSTFDGIEQISSLISALKNGR